ncbi:hypothetical protein HYZ80_02705 [Candidatus Parcubacteria bacterium]|nr:hypothetical protein [Candidatus Parcubacteria bacterium]
MAHIIGLKELRENVDAYVSQVGKGKSFIVVRRSKPIFKISSASEAPESWEPVADFTKLRKGGVGLEELLARL